MTTDAPPTEAELAELLRLAEAALADTRPGLGSVDLDFLGAVSDPQVILALVAEVRRLRAFNDKLQDALVEKGLYVTEDGRECFIDGCGEMPLTTINEIRAERNNLRRLLGLVWQAFTANDGIAESDVAEIVDVLKGKHL